MSLRTKSSAFVPGSVYLDKKWRERNYLLHQYRLHAIEGVPLEKPVFNESFSPPTSPRIPARLQSAKLPSTRRPIKIPRASSGRERPSSERSPRDSPYAVQKNNYVGKPRPPTSKAREPISFWRVPKSVQKQLAPIETISMTNKRQNRRLISPKHRSRMDQVGPRGLPATAKTDYFHYWSKSRQPVRAGKENVPRQKLRHGGVGRTRSEYSREALNKHYEKHQYIKNHILHTYRGRRSPPPEEKKFSDDYDEFFESSSAESELGSQSPPPSTTPSPPPEEQDLDENHNLEEENNVFIDVLPTPPPGPVFKDMVDVDETFIPPSTVVKIDKEATQTSSSEEDPDVIMIDGKKGRYKMVDGQYVLVEKKKKKKKSKKKHTQVVDNDNELKLNGDNEIKLDDDGKIILDDGSEMIPGNNEVKTESDIEIKPPREIYYIDYENQISSDDDAGNVSDGEKLFVVDSSAKHDNGAYDEADGDEEKAIISLNSMYMNEESGNQQADNEIDKKEGSLSDEETEDEAKEAENQQELLVEKYSKLREETPADFDAKKKYDSGSDLDEFGRRRDRARPSSSMYDYLPPLRPDPYLDDNDINKCKIRLSQDAVDIREAIAKNEGEALENAVECIISHNCDNRRWLRKLYRDEYLQSLLLDLRKTLPADIASVISYMMIPTCEYDAMCLWDALKGLHKDPEVLCEILCTRNNKELGAIREAYFMRYDDELIDHIEDETIDVFQKMLMTLALGGREEEETFTKEEAAVEARAISALFDVQGEYLNKKLIDVLTRYPIEMLRLILVEYRKFKGHDLEVDVARVLSGNFYRCIVTLLQYIQNPPNYFVLKLHNTHYKGVDDDKSLCRIIISRSERDITMIKQLFLLRYDMSLFDYVNQVCHGPLKGLVLRIIIGQITPIVKDTLPALFPGDERFELTQRLTLPLSVQMMLRKSKVVSKLVKLLYVRRERFDGESFSSDESANEIEPEQELPEQEEEEVQAEIDSEVEEELKAKEVQRELRNGLKNISFADDVVVLDEGKHKSVFQDVSFAAASRGILKNTDQEDDDGEDEENKEQVLDLDDELGQVKPSGPKMTQLNGPVLDPTFTGRGERNTRTKLGKRRKKSRFRGTVKGVDMGHFNALKDAQAIGKAMLLKNRNVEGILQFLVTRNNAQRQLIIREFFRRYRRDLVDDLRTLAPYHEEMTLSLLLASEIYDSASLFAAFESKNLRNTIDVLIEILCTRQNDEMAIIKRAFNGIFNMDLREEIIKISKGPFQNLLCKIAECVRDDNDGLDENLAKKDAQALFEALIKSRNDNLEFGIFVEVFATRTFAHIEAVCDHFSKITRVDILEKIDETLEREFLEAITAIICNVRDGSMYFCERIYRSASYEEKDFTMLIRCLISRAENDLQVIKSTFRRTYGRTIYNLIDKDCDFRSKKILLDVVKK